MIDDAFKLYLIECNTNPCLEMSAPLLGKLIPQMLDNAFRIAVDPIFIPPKGFTSKKGSVGTEICPENRFELIFDEKTDGSTLTHILNQKIDPNEASRLDTISKYPCVRWESTFSFCFVFVDVSDEEDEEEINEEDD